MRSSDDTDEHDDFDEAVEVVMRRLKVMNVHLLLAHVSHLEVENMATETTRLSHNDLVHITDGGMGGPGLLRLPFAVNHLDFARTQTVSVAVLERSADLLDLVLQTHEIGLEQFDLLHLGLAMFQQHDYSQALIAGWTICEQLISDKWHSYLEQLNGDVTLSNEEVVRRINSDRRKLLQDSSDYTISVITQILELAGQLDHDLFRSLNKTRVSRNKWLHDLDQPDHEAAVLSLSVASQLLSEASGVPIRLGFGRSISGV
jgi:hypothetical protein